LVSGASDILRRAVTLPDEKIYDHRLPRQLWYLYPLAPFVSQPVFDPHFFAWDRNTQLLHILESTVPFLTIPAAMHATYAWVVPPAFARFGLGRGHLIVHAAVGATVAALAAVVLSPLETPCHKHNGPLLPWIILCIVVTWTVQLPTLLVKQFRERAHEAENRALAEQKAALKAQIVEGKRPFGTALLHKYMRRPSHLLNACD
jgi:hypothetical protein